MAPSRHDWKIVDWDVKPQHNQPSIIVISSQISFQSWRVDLRNSPIFGYTQSKNTHQS